MKTVKRFFCNSSCVRERYRACRGFFRLRVNNKRRSKQLGKFE